MKFTYHLDLFKIVDIVFIHFNFRPSIFSSSIAPWGNTVTTLYGTLYFDLNLLGNNFNYESNGSTISPVVNFFP